MTGSELPLSAAEKHRRNLALLFGTPSVSSMMFRRQQWNQAAMTEEMFDEGVKRLREMEAEQERAAALFARKDTPK